MYLIKVLIFSFYIYIYLVTRKSKKQTLGRENRNEHFYSMKRFMLEYCGTADNNLR